MSRGGELSAVAIYGDETPKPVKVWAEGAWLFVFYPGDGGTERLHEKLCEFDSEKPLELKVASKRSGAGRLVFERENFLDDFARAKPKFHRPSERFFSWALILAAGGVAALAVVTYLLFIPFASGLLAERFPMNWEEKIAESQVRIIEGSGKQCDLPGAEEYLLEKAVEIAPGEEYRWRIKLLNESSENAFAMPAGYLYVHTGLVEKASRPDELNGVLAHEMAHVLLKHNLRLIIQRNFLTAALAFTGLGQTYIFGGVADRIAGLKYSRDIETEADEFAVDLLVNAGLSPFGLPHFFESTLLPEGNEAPPSWLSTHPHSEDRLKRLRAYIASKGVSERSPSSSDLKAWKAFLDQVKNCST